MHKTVQLNIAQISVEGRRHQRRMKDFLHPSSAIDAMPQQHDWNFCEASGPSIVICQLNPVLNLLFGELFSSAQFHRSLDLGA